MIIVYDQENFIAAKISQKTVFPKDYHTITTILLK